MRHPHVQKVELPAEALVARAFRHIDYADAYRVQLPAEAPSDIDTIVRAALETTPHWARLLMRLRDAIVGPIGLKTAGSLAERDPGHGPIRIGETIGIFRVYDRSGHELLLGQDDRHLDFRLSVLVQNDAHATSAIVSTIVRFNSWLGRAYFMPVCPFHKLIVPAMIGSAYQRYPYTQ